MAHTRDRAWRRNQRARVIANRKRFLLDMGRDGILEHRPDGMMADRHPFDCGHRCLMCHGEKFLRKQARRAEGARQWQDAMTAGESADCYDDAVHDWRYLRGVDAIYGFIA
jgi:hypothetical protein